MRVSTFGVATLAFCLFLTPLATRAEDDPGLLAIGAGAYNVLHKDKEAQGRLEYRFGEHFLTYIRPMIGVLATNERSIYAYGGFGIDVVLAQHYVLMPVAAVGYWDQGNGKNLGAHTEFKTGGEFAYRFDDASRLGVAFDHMSNAGIGKRNPGVESALVVFSIPLGR